MKLLRLGLILISSIFIFVACQQGSNSTDTTDHSHGQHTGVQVDATGFEGTWPPQPKDMSKTGIVAGNFRTQSSKNVQKAEFQAAVLNDAAIINALGNDYTVLDVNVSRDKAGNALPEVVLFSYSNNVTVLATVTRDNRVLHTVSAAEDYQFPENQEDINRSITLARAALIDQGFAGAANLNAHSMLTFPDRNAEKAFHDVRMLYVTLGAGNGVEPDYTAWVDLTNNQVVESGPIGRYEEGQ